MLLRLAYLTVTNSFAALRLLPMRDHEKDTEILVLRHQITVLERQLDGARVRFGGADRAFLAALLAGSMFLASPHIPRRTGSLNRRGTW